MRDAGNGSCWARGVLLDYHFLAVVGVRAGVVRAGVRVRGRVVVTVSVDRVEDAVGSFVKTVTEGVVLAVFVVISHITFVLLRGVNCSPSSLLYSNI